ncbi:histidine kinase dimerization/phospho-acceptor domain-containing protein [Eleftheria terrae]|uniref:histidine kinase dimerization/phospho-acceptor domain-containing protein n=1 Tax=Eleftheria terrae TaxID=1597781 RepID=UPI00263B4948|nr:histidine kinase dimerization/phospho-acceptor domain-containing protein [Eleftheria terrae]WKB53324.1 hypothetical protein N7L95_02695 [Eleftheria terrae]
MTPRPQPPRPPVVAPSIAAAGASDSIVGRLRRGIVGALLLSSLLTFGVLFLIGRAERVDAFERALADDLRTIANITQVLPDDDLYVNVQPESLTPYLAGGTRFFQVWDAEDGELLDESPSLQALRHRFPHPGRPSASPRRLEARLPDGRTVSLIWQHTSAHWGMDQEMLDRTGLSIRSREVHLLVGRLREELDESLRPLALACACGALLLPLLAAGVLAIVVPRALQPLHELRREVARRDADHLEPFEAVATREVRPVVERLNHLLARIAGARQRERQFLVDAAHELRTPLAELYAMADVALLRPDDAPRQAQALHDMKEVARRMSRLVDALFRLARQARQAPLPPEPVPLGELVCAAIDSAAEASRSRGLRWRVQGEPEAVVCTDAVLLRALLDNLVGNVVAHGRAGSQAVVAWQAGPRPEILVRNAVDERPQDTGGPSAERLGHGLTMVRQYARAMGARLQVQRSDGSFEARLRFGTAAQASPGEPSGDLALPP